MKLTNFHTNLYLTLTVLCYFFSLHSLSVSCLCYICKHNYDCCHCGATKAQTVKHQLLMATYHSTHIPRDNLNGVRETRSRGATSGVLLLCCSWHGSVTVLTANRWQRMALAAESMCIS
jgi:hypothetical protein